MKPELIIMLTHNDETVGNSLEIFNSCKDLPILYWGFKDIGIPVEKMMELNKRMKAEGKTTFLEVVTYTEEESLKDVQLAIDCDFDYLTGTTFYPSIVEKLKDTNIKYYPFGGNVGGIPVELKGTIDEIVKDCKDSLAGGANGVVLTPYRYVDGDPYELTKAVANAIGKERLMVAGSIGTRERIDAMEELGLSGYTMGSALFDSVFVEDGSFRDNLEFVLKYKEGA